MAKEHETLEADADPEGTSRDEDVAGAAPSEEPSPADPVQDPGAALAEAEARAAEHLETALRAKAEMENLRKRSAREVENAHKFGLERFVGSLLPVVDSLELGLAASVGEDAAVERIREGLELTLKMLLQALEKFEVEQLNPQDQPFNPEFHQAISMQPVEGVEAGTVVTVVQKGYLLHGRLVRPAMVIVTH